MNTRSVRGLVGLMIFASLAGISRAEVPKLIKDSTQEKIFKVIVHSKIKPFFVHLIYDVSEPKYPVVEKLEVYDVHKQLIQVLPVEMIEPPYEDAEFFLIEDMNFDGYKDLELLVSWG